LLLDHQYTVLLADARAHGSSAGTLATYGLLERNDVRAWFDWLAQTQHPTCLDGLGESMGAAQLLQAVTVEPTSASSSQSPRSPTSAKSVRPCRAVLPHRSVAWPNDVPPHHRNRILYGRWHYHLDLRQVSHEAAVAGAKTPILLIHGKADSNIPVRHSERVAARNPAIVLWEVPNADHCGAISKAPRDLETKLLGWFELHQSDHVASRSLRAR
jgi:fermentation-respiration switch protein FrsA (DUF1100 family)